MLTGPAWADRRVALVIGNSLYEANEPLPNPRNDARDMAAALERVGFEVILETDATKQTMERALARFARVAQDSDAAVIYYAGHALQFGGSNYLMPVDAKLEDQFSLSSDMISQPSVMAALDNAKGIKVLILDACRDNPLANRVLRTASRSAAGPTEGLAATPASYGTIVAYATQANKIAVDGIGRHSPFTAALLDQIETPGLEIVATFRRVIAEVYEKTDKRQLPEVSVQLVGEFYFAPKLASAAPKPDLSAGNTPPTASSTHDALLQAVSKALPELSLEEVENRVHNYEIRPRPKAMAVGRPQTAWLAWRTGSPAAASDPEKFATYALEGCQLTVGQPCALLAVNATVQPEQPDGGWALRDMQSMHYEGPFSLDKLPLVVKDSLPSRKDLQGYVGAPGSKAIAIGPSTLTVVTGERDTETSARLAQTRCRLIVGAKGSCYLYASENNIVLPQRREPPLLSAEEMQAHTLPKAGSEPTPPAAFLSK